MAVLRTRAAAQPSIMASSVISYITSSRFFSIVLSAIVKLLRPLPPPSKKEAQPHLQTQELLASPPQNSEEAVAIIEDSGEGVPVVRKFILSNAVEKPQSLHDDSIYTFFAGSVDDGALGDDTRLSKCVKKGVASIGKVQRLLQGGKTETSRPETFPEVIIGQGGFVATPRGTGTAGPTTDVFTKVQLQYPHGITSTQYFHSHCSVIKHSMSREQFKEIHISTGVCLFSEALLSMLPGHMSLLLEGDDPVIPPLLTGRIDLTLYELESIARLSSAIADVISLIGPSRSSADQVIIHVDIPDFQYHWTACELLKRNLVTADYVGTWIDVINRRKKLLGAVIIPTIQKMLRDRRLPAVKVDITSGTESAVRLIDERRRGEGDETVPALAEIIDALRTEGEDAGKWSEFFDHLDPRRQPSTVEDLGRLMYVFKCAKPGLADTRAQKLFPDGKIVDNPARRLMIQLDDIIEWRIMDGARNFLKAYSKERYHRDHEPVLFGLFPLQRVFPASQGRGSLYHDGPRECRGEDGVRVSPLGIIEMAYGRKMRDWLEMAMDDAFQEDSRE